MKPKLCCFPSDIKFNYFWIVTVIQFIDRLILVGWTQWDVGELKHGSTYPELP